MNISFTDDELNYIKWALAYKIDWVGAKIVDKIKDQQRLHFTRGCCKHHFGEYIGRVVWCMYCQAQGTKEGQSWQLLKEFPDDYQPDKPDSETIGGNKQKMGGQTSLSL